MDRAVGWKGVGREERRGEVRRGEERRHIEEKIYDQRRRGEADI